METPPPLDDLSILWIGSLPCSQHFESLLLFTKIFQTIASSIPYMKKLRDEDQVFCVIATKFSTDNIAVLRTFRQITRFYILTEDKLDGYSCFSDVESLFSCLQKDISIYYRSLTAPWNVFSWNVNETSLRQLSTDNAAFVWHQLILDIIQKLPDIDQLEAKKEFLDECRLEYDNNNSMKRWIEQFDREFNSMEATMWYTRDIFVYKLLNRALRMQEVDIIYKCRFMLKQLCRQLAELHQLSIDLPIETVYRTQKCSLEEFEKLQNSQGRLIAMSSFLSTSIDEAVSMRFANTEGKEPDGAQWLLYKIAIPDDMKESHTFAYIGKTNVSANPSELEVLLAPGAVFQVDSVPELMVDGFVWCINLRLATNQQCEEIDKMMNSIRERHAHLPNTLLTLGAILAEIGYFNSSLRFYQTLLRQTLPQSSNLPYSLAACVYSDIAALYYERGQYNQAIHFADRALDIDWQCRPRNIMSLLKDCLNRGVILSESNRNVEAMCAFVCALILIQILENSQTSLHLTPRHNKEYVEVCGQLYNNIGMFAQKLGKFSAAFEYYEKCYVIFKDSNDMISCSKVRLNMATLHSQMKEYAEASPLFHEAIEIQKRVYPHSKHAILSKSYASLALCCANMGQHEEALQHISTSLDIELSQQPYNYVTLANCYHNFAVVRTMRNEYQEALKCVQDTLHYAQKAGLHNDHPDIQMYRQSIITVRMNLVTNAEQTISI
ncbi:unnamed protein product [Adineta steineri]|uniref:NAD(P)(+)--arginine ADP-ribosyltransferase n=1 Tax=Adineta steineri TaxID=433720 RepID=A0A819ZMM5_9BILA|nr:unnamed protein product [Adineta steineri]CAF4165760.1 unnamed protein product [Adineta steineri]